MQRLLGIWAIACVAGTSLPSAAAAPMREHTDSDVSVQRTPRPAARAFVAQNGSLVLLDEHAHLRLELSAPLVACSATGTKSCGKKRDGAQHPALGSLLPYGYLLKACAKDYPGIVLPDPQRPLTAQQAAHNYAQVAECAMQKFYAKPYYTPSMLAGTDVCQLVLGSTWRTPTETDARYLTRQDREALDQLLPSPDKSMGGYDSLVTYARARDDEPLLVGFGMAVGVESLADSKPGVMLQRSDVTLRCVRTSSTPEQRLTLESASPAAAACGDQMVQDTQAMKKRREPPEGRPTLAWIAQLKDLADAVANAPEKFDAARVERESDRALPLARPFCDSVLAADKGRMQGMINLLAGLANQRPESMSEEQCEQLLQQFRPSALEDANRRDYEHLRFSAQILSRTATQRFHAACSKPGFPYTAPQGANVECDRLLRLMPKLLELTGAHVNAK
jgi:hypothetical protein